MAMFINTNTSSLNAQRNLMNTTKSLDTSYTRLSSGLRINSAKDDAAGLQISNRLTSQINGLDQGNRNATDGISLAQVAEGPLQASAAILQRSRELSIQSMNATNSAGDRAALNAEVQQLIQEMQRVAATTEFNGQRLLDGSFTAAIFQVGANANQTITATSGNFQTDAYGNFRIGALAATSQTGIGDLTKGQTAYAQLTRTDTGNVNESPIQAAGTLTINTATGTSVIDYSAGASAFDVAAAINQAALGISASATTQFVMGANDAGLAAAAFQQNTTYSFYLATDTTSPTTPATPGAGFTTVSFTTGGTTGAGTISAAAQLNAAAQAFNDAAGKTGLTAKVVKTGAGRSGRPISTESGKDLAIG